MKKNLLIAFAILVCFASGFETANAQGIFNKIKKKVEETTKTPVPNPTQTATTSAKSGSANNVKDVFRQAAPLYNITSAENADKVISQTFEGENRIAFKVPANLAISTEGTTRFNGEAKIFPTKSGGSLFAISYSGCTPDNM